MKKTIIFASVALATLFAFSSCQKENLENNYSENNVRVITAIFENDGTKTTLNDDGKTPEWKVGDVIRILNETSFQDVTLATENIDNNKITFTTELQGTLYAVYPASATAMTSCSGSIDFTIPTVQDGTFASANICVAKSTATDETNKNNLVFSNATSVLEFSQTASSTQVLRVAVTAANAIAGKLTASFGDNNKATISTGGLTGKIIYTTAAATAQDKYYVAVAPVETGDITFNYYKAEEEKSESKDTKTLALNKIYALTIPTEGYADSYVSIGGKKWAKYNLGATTVAGSYTTCYGDLYQWGSVNTLYDGFPWTSATAGSFTWKTGKTSGFAAGNREYTENAETLPDANDVVKQTIGGGWRMPTSQDFNNLAEACGGSSKYNKSKKPGKDTNVDKGIYWCTDYDGVAGCLFCDGTNKLFFPAAGYGSGTGITAAGSYGRYCSSSLFSDDKVNAYNLNFRNLAFNPQEAHYRYLGYSVRPVSD